LKPELGQNVYVKNRDLKAMLMGGLVLFIIGFLNGSLTSGTGLFATLWLVTWFGMDYQRAVVYTLILVGVFWNGAGAITLGIIGDVKWFWIPALLAGSLLGGYLGSHLAIKHGNRWIKRGFETVTIFISLKLLIG
jgi:hypothetical protein